MTQRRVGLWLIGAVGGVGSTTAVGLAALAQGTEPVGLVTALPRFASCDFDPPAAFVVGGHDIRRGTFEGAARELHKRSNVFTHDLLTRVEPTLTAWSANVRPGVVYRSNAAIQSLVDRPDLSPAATVAEAIARIQHDLRAFHREQHLDQMVVVNVASTEPPAEPHPAHESVAALRAAIAANAAALPTSSIYAYAAIDAGYGYVNFTPSCGANLPAILQLAAETGVPLAGQDGKTGETLLKSVLAPLFAQRHLKVLSWVGHNILGNRDGQILADPANKASKVKSKDALLAELLGYRPQSLVSIEYIESLDDWKTAWDHIHFEGFLGTKMTLQLTWQGCDSILAAPLVIDLARLVLRAQRRGEGGNLTALASFFKSPIGVNEHDFAKQFARLEAYLGS